MSLLCKEALFGVFLSLAALEVMMLGEIVRMQQEAVIKRFSDLLGNTLRDYLSLIISASAPLFS